MAAAVTMYRRLFPFKSKTNEDDRRSSSRMMKEQTIAKFLSPFESYVVSLQSLLIWEKPYLSAISLLLVNCLFWLIVSYSDRFYFLIGTIGIIVFLYRTWIYQIWPEIRVPLSVEEDTEEWTPVNPQVLSVPEISQYISEISTYIKNCVEWLKELRQDKPGTFCTLMCSILSVIVVIGNWISGVILAYITIMAIMLGPGFAIHILPKITQMMTVDLKAIFQFESQKTEQPRQRANSETEMAEFLLETNEEVLEALNAPMEVSDSEQDTNDTTVIAKELGIEELLDTEESDELKCLSAESMPSIEQDSNEEDDAEVNDFLLQPEEPEEKTNPPEQSINNEIQFVSTHFNEPDSDEEDEEDKFAEGLSFNEQEITLPSHGQSSGGLALAQSMVSLLTSNVPQFSMLSQNIVASVISSSTPNLFASFPDTARQEAAPDPSSSESRLPVLQRQQSETSDADLTDFEIVSDIEFVSNEEA